MTRSRSWFGVLLAAGLTLTVAGCTGTDFLNSGNAVVRVEVVAVGTPVEDFDCLLFELNNVSIRPLDGLCGAGSANEGEPCLRDSDCPSGSGVGACEGSNASAVIPNAGIVAVLNDDTVVGDLLSGGCTKSRPRTSTTSSFT